jgi:sarcosine oxidase subunit delta
MMLIPCPFCGPRAQDEFVCGGQTGIARPGPAQEVDDAKWAKYLYIRDNPRGWLYERWGHRSGCGEWFNLMRHTRTHEIVGPFNILDPRPDLQS